MTYPDFLCIGAQKAGTTWLHHNMCYHPGIWLPVRKEIHYFDKKFKISVNSYLQDDATDNIYFSENKATKGRPPLYKRLIKYNLNHLLWELKYRFLPKSDQWYASLFNKSGDLLTGDFTPAYSILDSTSVEYIYNLMPETKIIFIMRNPIERAWSHARMDRAAHAGKAVHEIDEEAFVNHFRSPEALIRTDYIRTLNNWELSFGKENVLPLFFDDIIHNPFMMMKSVYNFLGVDASDNNIPSSVAKKIHAGQELDIPDLLYKELYNIYQPQLHELANRFSGYPATWLTEAQSKISKLD